MKISLKKLMKNVISCFYKFSQTVSQNLWQYISSNKPIQTGPYSILDISCCCHFMLGNGISRSSSVGHWICLRILL